MCACVCVWVGNGTTGAYGRPEVPDLPGTEVMGGYVLPNMPGNQMQVLLAVDPFFQPLRSVLTGNSLNCSPKGRLQAHIYCSRSSGKKITSV